MTILSRFELGDLVLRYIQKPKGPVGLQVVPLGMEEKIVAEPDCRVEPLVQIKVLGDAFAGAFGNGITMRDSATVEKQRFKSQRTEKTTEGIRILTTLLHGELETTHVIEWNKNAQALQSAVSVKNIGKEDVVLELLASFSLGMITPFENGIHQESLNVYRMRSRWANEAVLERNLAEDLLLVPSSLSEEVYTVKFGHIGNKPTNVFIPFAAVEDSKYGVIWGMQIACGSSWQIEFSRRDNGMSFSGGLADADFGNWMKSLSPNEEFTTPKAYFTVCCGNIDDLCGRLVSIQKPQMRDLPEGEETLPVIFNEWCTSWGCPDESQMTKLVNRLKGWPIRYLVMDAGWYKDQEHMWYEKTGDWVPSKEKFPNGLKAVCDLIRAAGFIPGLWFELETCGIKSEAYQKNDMMLHRHGTTLISGARKFWDFRNKHVWNYMSERVIGLMKEAGIGYIKVDSNESAGIGCDGAFSLGEGLRQNISRVEDFFREMRKQIPDLVIENCSSGGHRLVNNFMVISSVASFSDAFESDDIPIIAANLHRVIQPRQSLIWCIVRAADDEKKLRYKLSSGFLGRIEMSGDVYDLSETQCSIVMEALEKYNLAVPVIRDGLSRRYGNNVKNYRHPTGIQAIVREADNQLQVLVVVHRFNGETNEICVPVGDDYHLLWSYKRMNVSSNFDGKDFKVNMPETREGAVFMLEKKNYN